MTCARPEPAKHRLRREMAARRRAVTPEKARTAGRAVAEHLAGCTAFAAARRVALYAALPDELPSRPCFEVVAASGRAALLPRMQPGGGLAFHVVERWEELRPGRYGVPEPPATAPRVRPEAGDLVLLPGVAFDTAGRRLGRGGGAYDAAFPPGVDGPWLVGVGFEFQVVDAVPAGPRDRRVDAIATERGIRRIPRDTR